MEIVSSFLWRGTVFIIIFFYLGVCVLCQSLQERRCFCNTASCHDSGVFQLYHCLSIMPHDSCPYRVQVQVQSTIHTPYSTANPATISPIPLHSPPSQPPPQNSPPPGTSVHPLSLLPRQLHSPTPNSPASPTPRAQPLVPTPAPASHSPRTPTRRSWPRSAVARTRHRRRGKKAPGVRLFAAGWWDRC